VLSAKSGAEKTKRFSVRQRHTVDAGVEVQIQVLFRGDEIHEDHIPAVGIAVPVHMQVFQTDLLDQSGLPRVEVEKLFAVRAVHGAAHLGAGVASDKAAVCDQGSLQTLSCAHDRATDAGKASSHDHKVIILFDFLKFHNCVILFLSILLLSHAVFRRFIAAGRVHTDPSYHKNHEPVTFSCTDVGFFPKTIYNQ